MSGLKHSLTKKVKYLPWDQKSVYVEVDSTDYQRVDSDDEKHPYKNLEPEP